MIVHARALVRHEDAGPDVVAVGQCEVADRMHPVGVVLDLARLHEGPPGRWWPAVSRHPTKLGGAAGRRGRRCPTHRPARTEEVPDERDHVWIVLHSGSRGVGNAIGTYFIELAKKDMRKWFINLPDEDLAYFPEGTDHFDDYVEAVGWAQDFAALNRRMMMANVIAALRLQIAKPFEAEAEAVKVLPQPFECAEKLTKPQFE